MGFLPPLQNPKSEKVAGQVLAGAAKPGRSVPARVVVPIGTTNTGSPSACTDTCHLSLQWFEFPVRHWCLSGIQVRGFPCEN